MGAYDDYLSAVVERFRDYAEREFGDRPELFEGSVRSPTRSPVFVGVGAAEHNVHYPPRAEPKVRHAIGTSLPIRASILRGSERVPVDTHRECRAGRRNRSARSPARHVSRSCGAGGQKPNDTVTPLRSREIIGATETRRTDSFSLNINVDLVIMESTSMPMPAPAPPMINGNVAHCTG